MQELLHTHFCITAMTKRRVFRKGDKVIWRNDRLTPSELAIVRSGKPFIKCSMLSGVVVSTDWPMVVINANGIEKICFRNDLTHA